jgi:dipeptidyl-peptidase-4
VLGGRIHIIDVSTGQIIQVSSIDGAFDPRLNPVGTEVAFIHGRALKIIPISLASPDIAASAEPRIIVDPEILNEADTVSWGLADFIAAEEMGRQRGHWWSSDGTQIAVCRVDESPVSTWYIADPAHPDRQPTAMRYPAAGSANAAVSLSVFHADGSNRRDLVWDTKYPYLATVSWASDHELLLTLQTRDQKLSAICLADTTSGVIEEKIVLQSNTWIDLFDGSPQRLTTGEIIHIAHRDGLARLMADDTCLSPTNLNIRSIISSAGDVITFTANELEHPEMQSVWQWTSGDAEPTAITPLGGTHSASVGGSTRVIRRSSLAQERATFTVSSGSQQFEIQSFSETPLVHPQVQLRRLGRRRIPAAIIFPRDYDSKKHDPSQPLPVLMDPYGGPHAQRVVDSYAAHCTSQWFADQGFAVIVVDGRGTPGLGTEWEQAIHGDLADVVLEDQVEALAAAADDGAPLDLTRVGIRGWSFGGYLAALAVLRRPDVFHAAIAGAPVTDWRLYDTHYTERYLGHPDVDDAPYRATSLIADAAQLTRPLLLVHGLADDNVVAAHTLQLSSALLAAGKPHEVLPLSGVSHMTPQAVVAENLLLHQLNFLRRSLGLAV